MNKVKKENVATKSAAQARLETLQQNAYEFFTRQYGEEEAKRAFEKAKPRLDSDVYPIIFPEPFEKETLPDVDFLVTIGKPNLTVLLRIARRKINNANKRIRELEQILAEIPQRPEHFDGRPCSYDTATRKGFFGEHCSYLCTFYQENHKTLLTEELRVALKNGGLNTDDFPKNETINEKIARQPCIIFDNSQSPKAIRERTMMIESAKAKIEEIREEKNLHVKYIHRITKAINDKRTLPNTPVFVDWRSKTYLQVNQIYCAFLSMTTETALYVPDGNEFKKVETEEISTKMQVFFCKITGKAFSGQYTGHEPMIFVSSHGEEPIKSGELYTGATCSVEKLINNDFITTNFELTTQPIPAIDQRIPRIMRIDELLELKEHPEYARMWAYTNYHTWHVDPEEIEPMLKAIEELNI